MVTATDFAAPMLERARQVAVAAGVGSPVETRQCDIHSLPFPDNSFILVMAMGVLPWLPSPDEPMRELVRVLRPDSYLIVNVDNGWRLSHILDPRTCPRVAGIKIPDWLKFLKSCLRRGATAIKGPPTIVRSVGEFDALLPALILERVRDATLGFGPFWLISKLIPKAWGIYHILQGLAEHFARKGHSTSLSHRRLALEVLRAIQETMIAPDYCTEMRTGVWNGDETFTLTLPAEWSLDIWWPKTPAPLTDGQLGEALERPVEQPTIRELCQQRSKPLVIFDNLNRPTPAHRVLPFVLAQFQQTGIPARSVRIPVATGTHGAPTKVAEMKKLGPVAAAECEILIHDLERDVAKVGRTSLGTSVFVNKAVISSDFVMGKGTTISLHFDVMRDVIRLTCGDPFLCYSGEVEFAREDLRGSSVGQRRCRDLQCRPGDISLTSILMKGTAPLAHCAPEASRIVLGSCSEGTGHHGLFPIVNRPRFQRVKHIARSLAAMNSKDLLQTVARRSHKESVRRNPIWVSQPSLHPVNLSFHSARFQSLTLGIRSSRPSRQEHSGKQNLRAVLYPCAPLQVLIERE